MNIVAYIHRCNIPRLVHQLTEEYNIPSSILNVCSLVITDKHFVVSCSEFIKVA
jgi:hypothetical protein